MKLKTLFLLNFFLFSVGHVFATPNFKTKLQPDTVTEHYLKPKQLIVWLNGGQLFRKEIQLGYERFLSDRTSFEVTLGYKIPVKPNGAYSHKSNFFAIYDFAERMPFSQAFLAKTNFKFYSSSRKGRYRGFSLSYRYRFYHHKTVSYNVLPFPSESWTSDQSLGLHIASINYIAGKTKELWAIKPDKKIVLDYYWGVGFKFKYAETTYYSKTSDDYYYHPPGQPTPEPPVYTSHTEKNKRFLPFSPILGFKIGYQF